MGYKYIIEVEKAYAPVQRRGVEPELPRLYLAKGFNSLVFDEEGLNKLEKYDPDKEYDRGFEQGCAYAEKENKLPTDAEAYGYEKGYEKGLNDAWEAARKIAMYQDNAGLQATDLLNAFKFTAPWSIFKNYSADEAIKKIKAYVYCARQIGGNFADIYHCLNGERKTHRGYHYEYVE